MEKLALPFPLLADPDQGPGNQTTRVCRREGRPTHLAGWHRDTRLRAVRKSGDTQGAIMPIAHTRIFCWSKSLPMGLDATKQEPPAIGDAEAGPTAISLAGLVPYLKGAKFAALALRSRHRELGDEFTVDAKEYVSASRPLFGGARWDRGAPGPDITETSRQRDSGDSSRPDKERRRKSSLHRR